MPDPAIEAAQRAWAKRGAPGIRPSPSEIAAADQALEPIREMHRIMSSDRPGVNPGGAFAEGMDLVLGELAELIFAKEES